MLGHGSVDEKEVLTADYTATIAVGFLTRIA
jgi:hypothetical protein